MSNLFKGFTAVSAAFFLTTMILPIEAISLTDDESLELAQQDKAQAQAQLEQQQDQAAQDSDQDAEAEKLKNLKQAQSPPQ